MSKFKESVIKVLEMIPKGKVVSYGQVALYVGMPRAARQVGWILNGLEEKVPIPWWRVINNKGYISIKGSRYSQIEQKALLMKENIEVGDNLYIDIDKYRFQPGNMFFKKLGLDAEYTNTILNKIPFSKPHFGN